MRNVRKTFLPSMPTLQEFGVTSLLYITKFVFKPRTVSLRILPIQGVLLVFRAYRVVFFVEVPIRGRFLEDSTVIGPANTVEQRSPFGRL